MRLEATAIEHPHFITARDALYDVVFSDHAGEGAITLLAGASRAGKTLMLRQLRLRIDATSKASQWTPPPGIAHSTPIPCVSHEAITSSRKSYSLDTLWRQLIKQLSPEAVIGSGELRATDSLSALSGLMKCRGTRWIIIDEAHHLLYFRPGRSSKDDFDRMYQQMEEIKNLVNMTGVHIVLAGSPKLLDAWNLSEQFGGRSRTVPLYLYNPVCNDDIKEFVKQAKMLMRDAFTTTAHLDNEFYLRLFKGYSGSIGMLSKYIDKVASSQTPETSRLLVSPNVLPLEITKNIMASDSELRRQMAVDEDQELSDFLSSNETLTQAMDQADGQLQQRTDSKVTSLMPGKRTRVGKRNNIRRPNNPIGV